MATSGCVEGLLQESLLKGSGDHTGCWGSNPDWLCARETSHQLYYHFGLAKSTFLFWWRGREFLERCSQGTHSWWYSAWFCLGTHLLGSPKSTPLVLPREPSYARNKIQGHCLSDLCSNPWQQLLVLLTKNNSRPLVTKGIMRVIPKSGGGLKRTPGRMEK